jgi:hypothetical protein
VALLKLQFRKHAEKVLNQVEENCLLLGDRYIDFSFEQVTVLVFDKVDNYICDSSEAVDL